LPSDPAITTVGFVGLGEMGGAIAGRIIAAAWPTFLWARRPDVLGGFAAPNVSAATDLEALAARCDLIGICVWADDDVREVVTAMLPGCRPGTVLAVHSTIAPSTCRELAAIAWSAGVVVLDVPVTGGPHAATAGELTVAVGGDADALERCLPVFGTFALEIIHLGGVGAGQFAKLINNALLAANLAVADDAISLGDDLGLEPEVLVQFLQGGSGSSYAVGVALRSRMSAATRQAVLPALDKDLQSLISETSDQDNAGILRLAAADALERLRHPPPGWT
jgi:3-hydroxyisobutyrate dehydrogenase-like beta-hydroxyacid dehydrogenase